jgi:N-methylhydantoinase B
MTLDPITLEIIWTRLVSIVDEAAATFVRTSFSTLARESNDFAVVLTDAEGRSVAQNSISIPSFIGTLPATVKHMLRHFPPATLAPGDVLITNDPWMGTGHIHDVTVVMPLFARSALVGFAGVTSHMPDIGGRLRSAGVREIYEEGLQIPMLKLVAAGKPDESVVAFIRANVRVPDATMGDIWGEVAACHMVHARLAELLEETGIDFAAVSEAVRGRSEAAMRAAIASVPDGTYHAEMQHDGFEERITVRAAVTVSGERVAIDFAGTSAQLPRAVNVVPIYVFAYTAYGVKAALCPDVPNNEGSFVPVTTMAPEGSILNPRRPAPGGARNLVGHLLPVAFMAAIADVMPERVWAPGSANSSLTLTGEHAGRRYAALYFFNGGQGGSAARPGLSATSFPSNLSNTPIEAMERATPVRVLHRRLRRGSGGTGAQPGGMGLDVAFEFLGDSPATASFIITRFRVGAPGLRGGAPGQPARLTINGQVTDPTEHILLHKGDRVTIETAGGGGFG